MTARDDYVAGVTAVGDRYVTAEVAAAVAPLRQENATLTVQVTALTAEVARLQAIIDGLKPTLLRGAACNVPDRSVGSFLKTGLGDHWRTFPQAKAGSVTIDQAVVTTAKAARDAGVVPVVSAKFPLTDGQLAAIAKALSGGVFIPHHEPEKDMRAAEFVSRHRHAYQVVKQVNPDVQVGSAHLAYAWRNPAGVGNAGANTGPLEAAVAWDVGDDWRDFTGVDVYAADGAPLETYPRFRAWYDYHLKVSRKPLRIIEYGQMAVKPGLRRDPAREVTRAQIVAQDAQWIGAQDRIDMWLYWAGTGDQGDWYPYDQGTRAAFLVPA